MTIKFTDDQLLMILDQAFCNAGHLHYGDMQISAPKDAGEKARAQLTDPSREELWAQVLRNGDSLTIHDAQDGSKHKFNLELAHQKLGNLPLWVVGDIVNGQDDADHGDWTLEYLCYGDKIYG